MDTKENVSLCVAACVEDWFKSSTSCQRKVPKNEWTVLSGIVLQISRPKRSDGNVISSSFQALACATGNKCTGRDLIDRNGCVVTDCHAEALARRSFMRYLYHQVLMWNSNSSVERDLAIFEKAEGCDRLRLKADHKLHMYISESPCGDASMYPLRDQVVHCFAEARRRRDAQLCRRKENGDRISILRLTGAKQSVLNQDLRAVQSLKLDKALQQQIGSFRTKSGRSDLPLKRQTYSMCCSDKIAKWNIVGIQGTLILQWFEPIFISSFVIGADPSCLSMQEQETALERALLGRLNDVNATSSVCQLRSIHFAVIPSSSHQFSAVGRTERSRVSSLAINWTYIEPRWMEKLHSICDLLSNPSDSALVSKFFKKDASRIEILLAAYGIREGRRYPPKGIDDGERCNMLLLASSRLSKVIFFRVWHLLAEPDDDLCTYSLAKESVRVSCKWSSLYEEFEQLRRAVFWSSTPRDLKSFAVCLK